MRLQGSRRTQALLIGLTISVALAVGYGTAALTGGGAPDPAALQFSDFDTTAEAETDLALAPVVTTTAELAVITPSPVATTAATVSASVETTAVAAAQTSTAAVEQNEVFIDETFDAADQADSFPTEVTQTWSAEYADQRYQLTLNGQTFIAFTIPLPAEAYRLAVDVAVDQGGAGVVFLYREPNTSYRIILTPDGAYAIERQEGEDITRVVDFTVNAALTTTPGEVNRLQIERRGNTIRFFANDQVLQDFEVPSDFENRYGFVLTARSGQGRATFDNLLGERLPNS